MAGMNLPSINVTLPETSRHLIVDAITKVTRDARSNYRITPTTPGTGAVDFHLTAAASARELVANAPAVDGTMQLAFTVQQAEAVSKILLKHRLRVDKEWKKAALAVRQTIVAASGIAADSDATESDAA